MSFDLPVDFSSEGWRIDRALTVTNVFVVILAAVAFAWLLWAVWAGRRRAQAADGAGSRRAGVLIPLGLAGLVFFVVDGHLFVTATRDSLTVFHDFDAIESRPDVLRLQISARQWAWDARYAGVDGRFGTADDVYVTNELPVPIGRPVLVQLAAVDVVHALHIPNLRVQIDAIPGRIGWTWFEVTRPGELDIACGQHCGVNHYKMAGRLRALTEAAFDEWLIRESRYASKLEAARAELPAADDGGLFPRFGREPDIGPRAWGWPWSEGKR